MAESRHEWHVASLVVRHRAEAAGALAATAAATDGLDLQLQEATCSVLLQESDGTAGLMSSIDLLQAVPGVLTVNLVYHHIEPASQLDARPDQVKQESMG